MTCIQLKVSSPWLWLLFCWIIFFSRMNFDMFYKIFLMFVSFAALVADEWSHPKVCLHVDLQITSCSANVVALVTFEQLFS